MGDKRKVRFMGGKEYDAPRVKRGLDMKKISILASVAALAFSGVAIAQPGSGQGAGRELSRAEAMARADQRFQSIDANRDGQITREEMRASREERRARRAERREQRLARMTPEQRERIAARLAERRAERGGQRGPGRAAMTPEQRAERRAQRRAQIEAMSPEQRAQMRAERQARRGQRGGGQGGGGQFAGGGTVSLEEFRARALQRFERLDGDNNGVVTREERREARQQRRREGRAG